MSISTAIGYVAILIALGFVLGALPWAADKSGAFGLRKEKSGDPGEASSKLCIESTVPSSTRDQVPRIAINRFRVLSFRKRI
jgi:hypothetical protein